MNRLTSHRAFRGVEKERVQKKLKLVYAAIVTVLCFVISESLSAKSYVNKNGSKHAIEGYDPVAYFTKNQAIKGSKKYSYRWKKATWLFSSKKHKKLFAKNPKKYAPIYGGYCAYAVSRGYTAKTDPKNAWTVYKDRLYLNYNKQIKEKWEPIKDQAILKANKNWPKVLKKGLPK